MQHTAPGVYTPELGSGARTIAGASTAVTLFVGPALAGIDLTPQHLNSFADFQRLYGGLCQASYTSYSVLHFFANGGSEALFIRVPAAGAAAASGGYAANGAAARALTLTALSSGAGGTLLVEFDSAGLAPGAGATVPPTSFNLTLTDRVSGMTERYVNLTTLAGDVRAADRVLNDPATGSRLVRLTLDGAGGPAPAPTGTMIRLAGLVNPGASFAGDSRVTLQVDVLDAGGAYRPALGFTLRNVTIFKAGEKRPAGQPELIGRTVAALNAAIAADASAATPVGAAARMNGLRIEASLQNGGGDTCFRVSAPGRGIYAARIGEAAVRLAAPDPVPGATSWLADFTDPAIAPRAGPARYVLGAACPADRVVGVQQAGADGDASGQPSERALLAAVQSLDSRPPFFDTLCLPELARPAATGAKLPFYGNAAVIQAAAAQICDHQSAFLIVDPPPGVASVSAALAWKASDLSFRSNHAGAWFPAIRVDDPLVPGAVRAHPPSGAIAGLMARLDARVGVWRAPAGADATLTGVHGPSPPLSDADNALLNPVGVNAIRQFPQYGTVSFGARTLDGADALASDWKYVAVRRTGNYILRSLAEGLRWTVFEPSAEPLWAQLRAAVGAFLQGLFRQGAFKGATARDAFFVKCDATTTTAADLALGVATIMVGFAPLKPAEFIIITLRQQAQPPA